MSIKLTDTQLVLLGAAAQRKDLCLVAPPTLKGATAQKVASKLISAGFVKEVKAILSSSASAVIEEGELEYRTIASGARAGEINLEDCAMCMHFVHAGPFFFCPVGGYSDPRLEPRFGHHISDE